MAQVEALCISRDRGTPKCLVAAAAFRADHGIDGDAHAGPWHRQVSLLAMEDIETIRHNGLPDLQPGAFAENVVVSGLAMGTYGLGTRLRLGKDVVLTITQIGKVCHSPCQIQRITGDCIMPRLGLFARVEQGGLVNIGDAAAAIRVVPRDRFQAVVITVSDRCAAGQRQDTAGPAVADRLRDRLGAHVYRVEVVPDERRTIAERLRHYCDGHSIDIVLAVGGTGFSPRDVTPEATREVLERLTPGLDEIMRAASMQSTPQAMLSRGVSGIRGSTLVIDLPGSPRAAIENLEAVLPALQHGLLKLRGDSSDCARSAEGPLHV